MSSYICCDTSPKEIKRLEYLSSLLKLVTEKSRLRILCLLRNKNHCVCEIIEHTKQSQSLVSHHLMDLKKAGIVSYRKNGRRMDYSITNKGMKVADLLFSI